MTSFKTAESPFKSDNTASNRCGVTLMNNQVGAVVAQVMATHENVTVTPLPSMIRVDAIGRMDFIYNEISDALGEEEGYFDAAPRIKQDEKLATYEGRGQLFGTQFDWDENGLLSPLPLAPISLMSACQVADRSC